MTTAKATSSSAQIFRFRQSDALLRNVMENAAVGMALVGGGGRLVYANQSYAAMFGYAVEECVGLAVEDLVDGKDLTTATRDLDRLTRGEIDSYRAERQFKRRDGSTFWGLVSTSALRDERSRRPIYIIAQITDIDQQKRGEAALAESESRWNFALEGAGQGVWDHDLRNKRAFFSRTWRTMRGFAPDEDVDESFDRWMERMHPDDRARITEIVKRQNSGEIPYNAFEYREKHRNGQWIWILSRGKPIEWMPDGSVGRIIGTDTDITSLKAIEAILADEKERLRVTLASISEGVIATDADMRVTFLNPIAEELTGWRSGEASGRPLTDVFAIIDEGTGAAAENPVAACLQLVSRTVEANAVLSGRGGGRRDVRHSAAPVRTPAGDVVGAVLVFQDITASRVLQRELAHSATHDALTALLNRAAFEDRLRGACEQAKNEKRESSLCFIDLDHFKLVNDRAGHAAGDALLQIVAETIRRGCRERDVAARIGGDEFALLLWDCQTDSAAAIAAKIVQAIASLEFMWEGARYVIGASVGVTGIDHRASTSAVLMGEADVACYAAKDRGRNQVVVFDRREANRVEDHLALPTGQ
jgi:diguanylate cyclase (GGDEF)-like protein/PAS domain S-box-containing protein